ncbi:hypothetical protein C6502_19430 [Candidatus Poribacteria bacterium]|nr:MAG: hypothetical protein C6502_19430 [Candidatus Poribacteria bacterium]
MLTTENRENHIITEVVYISITGDRYHKYRDCPKLRIAHKVLEVSLKSVKECEYKACTDCW